MDNTVQQAQSSEYRDPPPRVTKPNYNQIHALPLPLAIYALPPLIPHNPLSLLYIAYTYISQVLRPSCSHPGVLYTAYFSSETLSVHVTDPHAIRALWTMGFFGKGTLSRSEPSWLDREQRRRGLLIGETSEEVTMRRREERKEFKRERARKEREAIEEKLRQEGKTDVSTNGASTTDDANGLAAGEDLDGLTHGPKTHGDQNGSYKLAGDVPATSANLSTDTPSVTPQVKTKNQWTNHPDSVPCSKSTGTSEKRIFPNNARHTQAMTPVGEDARNIENQEHLQLTLEEAYFLAYGLGVLNVVDRDSNTRLSSASLFSVFRKHSYFPPCPPAGLKLDDPFLISYVTYHHFRSLGWVVRPGVKFAVDYLLYNRGPVFSHAEFAVMIIPSYSHPYWTATTRKEETQNKQSKSWWWLNSVNRVQSQVRKSLILAYVEVPPADDAPVSHTSAQSTDEEVDVGKLLKRYKIREVSLKRWIPNRSRD